VIRVDEDRHFKVRKSSEVEWWLDSPGPLWVLERV